jgi:hypothetical protein
VCAWRRNLVQPGDPGVWAAVVRSRTTAVQAGNHYFFFLPLLLFLPFLPFLATPLTPLPDSKVNEMLTRRVNVSLTGSGCRLR